MAEAYPKDHCEFAKREPKPVRRLIYAFRCRSRASTWLFFSACSASFSQLSAIFRSTSLFLKSDDLSAISVHITACSRYAAATTSLPGIHIPVRLFTHPEDKTQHWALVPALHTCLPIYRGIIGLRGRFCRLGGSRPMSWSNSAANVCFWHKADISIALSNVRFWGKADIPSTTFDVRQ